MKKPKIKILKENRVTDLEREIITAGAPPCSKEDDTKLRNAATDEAWTWEFSPAAMEKLKEMGLTPEQLLEKIANEKEEENTKEDSTG